MSSVTCAGCGASISDEPETGEGAQRKPCPQCGSTARNFSVSGSVGLHIGGVTAELQLISYPARLLDYAKAAIETEFPGVAVLLAHMACEVAVERTLAAAFKAKNIEYLQEPVEEFLNGYSLANPRIRKLYTTLTGDEIAKQSFWAEFKQSAERRNAVAHEAINVSKADATRSVDVVTEFIAHLKQ